MPQPAEVRAVADQLIRVYTQAWNLIIREQKQVLRRPERFRRQARLREMRRTVEAILDAIDAETRRWVAGQFPNLYRLGAAVGAAQAGGEFADWTLLHREAVQRLATDTFNDLLDATTFVREDTKRFIREVSKIAAELTVTTDRTAVGAGRELEDVLKRRGISAVTYKNGSRHGLREYAQMVIRTKSAVAYNEGVIHAASEQGVKWFEVLDGPSCGWSAHESGELALGKIVTRDECLAFPISHPNCRRSFGARPDLETDKQAKVARPSTTPEQIADQVAADLVRTGQLD